MKEWRDIPGYEGYYIISEDGDVKAIKREIPGICKGTEYTRTIRERELKFKFDDRGYKKVGLCKEGKVKLFSVHRLVMYAFKCVNNDLTINHIDSNKNNNHYSNLEYCSNLENIHHYRLTRGSKVYNVFDTITKISYNSLNEAGKARANELKLKNYTSSVSAIKRNKNNRYIIR
jgi:hypothetical protein